MKSFLINTSAAALVASSTLLFGACAVNVDRSEKENVSGETVGALTSMKDLGEIPGTGEPRTAKYKAPPRYAAYTFYADLNEEIDVWVRGAKGKDDDAVAWVLDGKERTLGFNDDADKTTLDAHITLKAPNAGAKSKYLVVFRDYYLANATFTVTVTVKPAAMKCSLDADCAAMSVDPAHVAICDGDVCKAVLPTDIACGGFIKNSHSCPEGYFCKKEGVPMDVPGKCVAGCVYGGTTHAVGESFKSTDGCNTCSCMATGGVACTKMACLPPKCDESKEPNRKYVGHSKDQCMLVKFMCEPGTTMFSNDCGCGCEQPSDCPEFINCMPGPGDTATKCAALRAKCPFTPVAY